ncbi:phosphoribosyl-AMP cyclohydrolase [Candidatus Vidania fulgoroideorum]
MIPIIVQNIKKDIIMQAWGNIKCIKKTNKFGYSYFFSRKRSNFWIKGEISTNFQIVKKILYDCDKDCYLYIVDQVNKICCHKKKKSCFFNEYK